MKPWFITSHAMKRMGEMDLSRDDVVKTLNSKGGLDYPSRTAKYGAGFRVKVMGQLAVVYRPTEREVVTILWHGKDGRDTEDPE